MQTSQLCKGERMLCIVEEYRGDRHHREDHSEKYMHMHRGNSRYEIFEKETYSHKPVVSINHHLLVTHSTGVLQWPEE